MSEPLKIARHTRTILTPALIRAMMAVRDGQVKQIYTETGNVYRGPKGIGLAMYRRLEATRLIEDVPGSCTGKTRLTYKKQLSGRGRATLDKIGFR